MSLIGRNFGRYQVLELLGEGGMATVYKAQDTRLDREVAIKVIRRDAFPPEQMEMLLKRFEREAKSLAKISHPNIVGVLDYGKYEGSPYLVMEYLSGGTLTQRLGKAIPWREAAQLIMPIANALDYIHDHNIINRDVKPSNVLMTDKGQPMLTDFGLVKIFSNEGDGSTHLTSSGAGVGTPDYMAPEQWTGETTFQSDLYSLGVMFYEMITGRRPYTADTPAGVLLKQATEPLPRPSYYIADLPRDVESFLLKALAKEPKDRHPDMHAFIAELQDLLGSGQRVEVSLPAELTEAIEDPRIFVRESAIGRLEKIAKGENHVLARSAHKLLEKMAAEDDSRRVAQLSTQVLENIRQAKDSTAKTAEETPKAKNPPTQPVEAPKSTRVLLPLVFAGLGLLLLGVCAAGIFIVFNFLLAGRATIALTPTNELVEPQPSDSARAMSTIFTLTKSPNEIQSPVTKAPTNTPGAESTITGKDGTILVYVPAGPFAMGSNTDSDEQPIHSVDLSAYYMDQYEVTNKAYKRCVDAGVCASPKQTTSSTRTFYYLNPEFDDYPVVYVDWSMAKKYCEWRGARLPTEAEWEKAARGMEGGTYPWGEKIGCDKANYQSACIGDTTKVGSYESGKSPYGIYDMAGNVWEWVNDWYDKEYYKVSLSSNPFGSSNGQERIVRGGAWNRDDLNARSANRNRNAPDIANYNLGFRCVTSP